MVFNGFLNEFKNLIWNLFLRVEERLLLVILPVEREVQNSNGFPKIAQLSACRVYDACDLICDDEFQILKGIKVRVKSCGLG